MALYKMSMVIQQSTGAVADNPAAIRLAGWTESFYTDAPSVENLQLRGTRLSERRAACLPVGGVVVGQRYQAINPVGASAVTATRFPGGTWATDYPSLALLCRASSRTSIATRPLYVRDIPDVQITRGEYTPTNPFRDAVQGFFNELSTAGWAFRAQDRTTPQVACMGIDAFGVVTMAQSLVGVAVGSKVRVLKAQQLATTRLIGGVFYVSAVTNDKSFTLRNWTGGICNNGSLRLVSYVYPVMNNVDISRIVTKKVGRPPELFRGRRSKRR